MRALNNHNNRLLFLLFWQLCCCCWTDGSSLAQQQQHENSFSQQRRKLRNKTFGNARVLVLLVRFTNHATRTLPPREHFEKLCQEQMAEYMKLQSYGQYNITGCDVTPWTTTTISETEFAAGERGFFNALESSKFFTPILDQMSQDPTVDWSRYDDDQDSELDALLVFHSGYPSEGGDGSSCGEPSREDRVRSQAYWSSPFGAWTNDIVTLNGYAIASAYDGVCDLSRWVQLAVPAHEFLHTFETVDLYDSRNGFLGGLGGWDIMASSFGPVGDTMYPGSMSPWSRALTGWHKPKEVTGDGTYTLRPSNLYPDALMIAKGFPSREYLLLENRQPLDYDEMMFGDGGILIYHIDDTKFLQETPGYPGQEGWPINGNHYRVALLPADGLYDLEKGNNNGDATDLWTQGMVLRPGTGANYPNTDSYQGGIISPTGITIEIMSPSGMEMQVRITGIGPSPAPTEPPQPTASPTIDLSPAPTSVETTFAPTTLEPTTIAPTTLPPNTPEPTTLEPTVATTDEPSIAVASDEPTAIPEESSPSPSFIRRTEAPTATPVGAPTRSPVLAPVKTNQTTLEPNLNNSSVSGIESSSALSPLLWKATFFLSTVGGIFVINS